MKRFLLIALATIVMYVLPATGETTDRDTFEHLVAKGAPSAGDLFFVKFKPKLACVCVSGQRPGVVSQEGDMVSCVLVAFDADGSVDLNASTVCAGDFVVLGR